MQKRIVNGIAYTEAVLKKLPHLGEPPLLAILDQCERLELVQTDTGYRTIVH